ncbi:MAG: rRNA maturation RNase YbeY [Tissierellia bacterium]|nr:rRNA maturation RNase YbeY [Tissierellia bacterium]
MNLLIDNRDDNLKVDDNLREDIISVIKEVLKVEKLNDNFEISLSFVDEDEIRKLNKTYRNIDNITDVLSFPLGVIEDSDYDIPLGDIVICVQRAKEQAMDYGHSLQREIMYLTCHSMLHLLGYDHIEQSDKEVMRSKEKEIMKNLGVFK